MKYRCIIVDDEDLARELIETYLSQLPDFELVASCVSAIEASAVLQNEVIDLLFLDIEMPVLKGTEFLKNLIDRPKVIFTTAYRDYALEGFELDAVDYLLKPIVFERFFKGIQKFLGAQKEQSNNTESQIPAKKSDFVFVSKDRKQIKVQFDEVLYIESLKDYIRIHLKNENHVVKYGISVFEKELDSRFARVHRSYIVNLNEVTAFTKNDIEIGNIEIPIGSNYKDVISSRLKV